MQIVATFDPSVTTSDTFTVPQSSANGKMVVWNESNISIQLSFQNGDTAYVPAWTARMFCGEYGNVNVTWEQHSILTSNQPPLSQVVVETFGPNEMIPGTFPATLSRQTNIGNAGTVLTATSSIQNDGNNAGTSLIEATVVGDAFSAVTLTNNAIMVLGDTLNPGSLTMAGPIILANNIAYEGKTFGGIAQQILYVSSADHTNLQSSQLGGPIFFNDQDGNAIAEMTRNTGITIVSGGLVLVQGSLTRLDKQTYTPADTNIHTYAHSLGAIPDLVIPTFNATASGFTASVHNFTATTFDMIASNSGHAINILLVKF